MKMIKAEGTSKGQRNELQLKRSWKSRTKSWTDWHSLL